MLYNNEIILSRKRGRISPDEESEDQNKSTRKKLREARSSNGEQFLLREEKMMNGVQRVEGKDIGMRKKEEFCHTLVGKGKPSDYSGVKMKNFEATWKEGKEEKNEVHLSQLMLVLGTVRTYNSKGEIFYY